MLVVNNLVLKAALKRLGPFEKHTSKSALHESASLKMFLAQFVNTALVALVATATSTKHSLAKWPAILPKSEDPAGFGPGWYATAGGGVCLSLLLNAVVPKLAVLWAECWRSCRRRRACICCIATQEQMNTKFAGQKLDLADRYATMWNTIFSCMFYSSGMPLLLLVGSFDLWLLVMTEKHFFFHYYSNPAQYDELFAVMTVKMLPTAAVLHLAMACWVYSVPAVFTEHALGGIVKNGTTLTVGGIGREPDEFGMFEKIGKANVWPVFLFVLFFVIVMIFQSYARRSLVRLIRALPCKNQIIPGATLPLPCVFHDHRG